MTPSPFHGIFSSFGNEQDTSVPHSSIPTLSPKTEETLPPEDNLPAKSQRPGQIAVDIFELDNYYIIRAPIAGVRLSDLDIEVDEKSLTISGTRTLSDSIAENQYYLQECFWGEFSRSITLPCIIDPKKIKATFSKDCILKVIIPKEEKVKIVRVSEA